MTANILAPILQVMAKKLDRRLESLGATPLLERGLGDDQVSAMTLLDESYSMNVRLMTHDTYHSVNTCSCTFCFQHKGDGCYLSGACSWKSLGRPGDTSSLVWVYQQQGCHGIWHIYCVSAQKIDELQDQFRVKGSRV
jgi:hypothetical protein